MYKKCLSLVSTSLAAIPEDRNPKIKTGVIVSTQPQVPSRCYIRMGAKMKRLTVSKISFLLCC